MAQAVFDQHPLGDYLRGRCVTKQHSNDTLIRCLLEAGESQFSIPGITSDFERELDPNFNQVDQDLDVCQPEWRPRLLIEVLQVSAVPFRLELAGGL